MKRKVIQIALTSDGEDFFVLCDDGTMWQMDMTAWGRGEGWQEIGNVPQPPPPSEEERIKAELRFEEMKKRHEGEGRTSIEPS